MGRRDVSLSDPARWVFNRLARDYEARPPYPDALVERVCGLAGGPGARVADVGAGTGLLASPLAARGLRVWAVEPAEAMLRVLASRAGNGEGIELVHAAAESTGMPAGSMDLVLMADAVHWVDPELARREAERILRPGGILALVEAPFARTPFMDALAALLARENPRARRRASGAARELLAIGGPGSRPVTETFRHGVTLGPEALEAVVRSLSYAGPALAPLALARLLQSARALVEGAGTPAKAGDAAAECPPAPHREPGAPRCDARTGARFERDLTLSWVRRPAGLMAGDGSS